MADGYAFQLQTAMLEAAGAGYESDVARLLALDPSLVDACDPGWQRTPLHEAATNGHDGVVAQLLALSPQASDARDRDDVTALHLAAQYGHDKIVVRLLAHNPALIDAVASHKLTALHSAAWGGHESTVVQLLNHSPGLIDLKTAYDQTALHIAALQGHVKVVAELLTRRPSLVDEDWRSRTPLFCAVNKGHQEVVDLFPLTTDQVHRRDKGGNTLLHLVIGGVRLFKPALIQRVWEMNPDALLMANEHGYTPFDCAISSVHEWAIEYFQWKLSVWSVEEALEVMRNSHTVRALQRFRVVVQEECERPLLLSLPRDCVPLISDYLFISDSILSAWS